MPLFRTVSEAQTRRNFRYVSAHRFYQNGEVKADPRLGPCAMAKITDSQEIFSEIELLITDGRYEDAKVLLSFVNHDTLDRNSRLRFLLINAILDGPTPYKSDIDQLRSASDPSDAEKEIISKILLLEAKSTEADGRNEQSTKTLQVNQARDQTVPRQGFENQRREGAGSLQNHESEPVAWKKRIGEPSASRNQAGQSPEEPAEQNREIWNQESALNALEIRFSETIRSLECQLSKKDALLESREADIQAIRAKMDQVTAQLAEFGRAKDQEDLRLRAELTQKSELLQLQEAAIKTLEDRFAAQIRDIECELSEKRNLLESRDTELDSLKANMSQLTRENAALASERDKSDRLIQEELREATLLLQAKAFAIGEMEQQMSAKIESLGRQLAEKQKLLDGSYTEMAELRSQVFGLTKKFAEVEGTQSRAKTLLNEVHNKIETQPLLAADLVHDSAANGLTGDRVPAAQTANSPAAPGYNSNSGRPNRFLRGWQFPWDSKTFPTAMLPTAAVGLVIITIAYFSFASGRRVPDLVATIGSDRTQELAAPDSASRLLMDPNVRKTVDADSRPAKTREDRPKTVAGYVTRRVVLLRQWPRFAATPKEQLAVGTSIRVLEVQGNWLKVKTWPSRAVGYVRKEYLVHQSSAR